MGGKGVGTACGLGSPLSPFFFLIQFGIRQLWILANGLVPFIPLIPIWSPVLHSPSPPSTTVQTGDQPPSLPVSLPNPLCRGDEKRRGGGDTIPPQASGKALPPWALPFPVGFLPDTFVKNQT